MVKRRNHTHWRKSSRKTSGRRTPKKEYVLEQGSIESLIAQKERTQLLLKFHWDFYSELAYLRQQIEPEITLALNQSSISNFTFKNWQRGVKYKYCLHPFSTVGSLSDPGGRFNIGAIAPQNIPQFPALYIAVNKETALQETLGQTETGTPLIDSLGRALTNPASFTYVSVSGTIERIFDLRNPRSLDGFVSLIKDFEISKTLIRRAQQLEISPIRTVVTVDELIESFLDKDWRKTPMLNDVPANSQIFGHLLYIAGIEGVIYPSKFTGQDCIALFPHHFAGTDSFVELDDATPHPKVPKRVDKTNWKICDQTPDEIIGF